MEGHQQESAEKSIQQALSEYDSLKSNPNWEDLGSKNQVHGFRLLDGNRLYTKGVGTIPHPVQTVANFLSDPLGRRQYMSHLESIQILHDYGDLKIVHEVLKLHWPVSNRDLVYATKNIKAGGDVLIISKSVEIGFEQTNGVVRAEVLLGVFHLRTIEGVATEVTHISGTDPKGSVPKSFVNMMSKRRAFMISSIRDLIK